MRRRLPTFAIGAMLAAYGGWVLAQEQPQLKSERGATTKQDASAGDMDELVRLLKGGPPKNDAKAADADELGRLLTARGFTSIALDRLRSGHLTVAVSAAGTKLRLVLDTGAPVTCLDPERTKAMNLKWGKLSGVGPAERDPAWDTAQACELDSVDFGAFKTDRVRVCVYRVASINQWLELYGDPPIDGVLGGDVLAAHAALIDYPKLRLYLRLEP